MPHPIVAQFASIQAGSDLWPLYSIPADALLGTVCPHDMQNVEEDTRTAKEIKRLYNIIKKHLAPLWIKERQQDMDFPQLRTILAAIQQDLKNHEKSIRRENAKKYLRDCRKVFQSLDPYLQQLITIRLHIEGRLKSEASASRFMDPAFLQVGLDYELAFRSFGPKTLRTESFIDLDIIELAKKFAIADKLIFDTTYKQVETSLESNLNSYLPKEEEEQRKYLLALRALLPDILKHIGTYNRNRLIQLFYSEIFNKIISKRMSKLPETEGLKTDEEELAHNSVN